ncbi:putative manganese efflux pump MntP [Collibacillus ludicampi]|uniref:Putative manganese efflux pump MntP n=1 Tax=Collibacillus ludicampi TaxID=2771369 RepID=A0AAV4LD28_9BACL|nr:manganese efflux pump MntP family protein [Collibacillus ludicampi]GIM45725.1 putative manganese efflux pump MntP [Collibacillus ludicampi]
MVEQLTGEMLTLMLIAIALGTDAFSLCLGLGMQGLTKKEIGRISVTIGGFHVLMPLVGMFVGIYLSRVVGEIAKILGALMLIGLGIHMVWQSVKQNQETVSLDRTAGIGLLLFSMSVSMDALSVGFSLGLFEAPVGLVVSLFGIVGACMAALGLSIGSRVSRLFGEYGEIVGGAILFTLGLKFLL